MKVMVRNKELTVRVKSTANGYSYFSVKLNQGVDPITHKQRQKEVTAKSLSDLQNKVDSIVGARPVIPGSEMTLAEWMDYAIGYDALANNESSIAGKESMCKNWIVPYAGDIRLCDLTSDDLFVIFETLKAADYKSMGSIRGLLSTSLDLAVAKGLITSNPVAFIKLADRVREVKYYFTEEDNAAFLRRCNEVDQVYGLYFKFLLETGLRPAEGLGLTWSCIDWERKEFVVHQQLKIHRKGEHKGKLYIQPWTKNKIVRRIKLSRAMIRTLKAIRAEQKKHAPTDLREFCLLPNDLVFTRRNGNPLRYSAAQSYLKREFSDLVSSKLTLHALRHCFATNYHRLTNDPRSLQAILGHKNISMTLDYVGTSLDAIERGNKAMDKFFRRLEK